MGLPLRSYAYVKYLLHVDNMPRYHIILLHDVSFRHMNECAEIFRDSCTENLNCPNTEGS